VLSPVNGNCFVAGATAVVGVVVEPAALMVEVVVDDRATVVPSTAAVVVVVASVVVGVGSKTTAAVEQLQNEAGLPVTGLVDRATATALDKKLQALGGAAATNAHTQTPVFT
jgi:hypothetical protein